MPGAAISILISNATQLSVKPSHCYWPPSSNIQSCVNKCDLINSHCSYKPTNHSSNSCYHCNFSIQLFTVKNKPLFTPNNEIHKYRTRNNTNLNISNVNITKYYKGPYISGLKAFTHLPLHIKSLANDIKSFKISLKRFLYHHSFYSIEEYYEYNDDKGV